MKLSKEEIEKMIDVAKEARKNAFVFKAGAKGACVLTSDGKYFGGCNVEAIISTLGVCAEMSAMDHAVVHGNYQFKAIAVVNDRLVYPCGACLQYLTQFYQVDNEDIWIISADEKGNYKTNKLSKLLPEKYESQKMEELLARFKKV